MEKEQKQDDNNWYVYKTRMGNICKVQQSTELPRFGDQHLGPYNSRFEANTAMVNDVDATMQDPARCWQTT